MKNIIVIGSSGHGKVVIDVIEKENKYIITGLFDDKYETTGSTFFGYEILGKTYSIPDFIHKNNIYGGIIAIGDNWTRYMVFQKIKALIPDFNFIRTIHPSASIGRNVITGDGTVIMAGSIINSDSKIGEHSIINTGASIDHDNIIGNFASIAPGVTTGGNVNIDSYSAISLGVNIIHGINIGKHTVIGAGSTVLKDIPSYTVAYGTPAKVIRRRKEGDRYL